MQTNKHWKPTVEQCLTISAPGIDIWLKEKLRLFSKYRAATSKLKAGLKEKNMEVLEACIRKRQGIIGQIDRIDDRIKAAATVGELPQLKDMKPLLNDISLLEAENLDQARSQRAALRGEILTNRKQMRGAKGYQMASPSAPARFVDKTIR